ncbi:MAG: Asp-tRNA(Asn)/Glu-tRNA(Gln) amidotransferase subunit GatC [Phycisphaerales bacterium]|nr:Asp-tRNA(Asn)/Glu-tRNA(Gln) amidotransferase subunit GatC [Phycisphaerales bacterium]
MPEPLSTAQVEHVAKLARLRLAAEQVERYRGQLSSILDHIAALGALDLDDIEPLAHPHDMTNRLGDDIPTPPMPLEALLRNAPAVEGPFLAVPKVLDEGGG